MTADQSAVKGAPGHRKGWRSGTPRAAALAVAAACAALPVLAPMPARAERWNIDAGVGSQLTWSSNPELGVSGGRDDVILDLRPRIAIRGEGARLRVTGSAALNAIATAHGTQDNEVLPEADLNARLEAIERLFFVEAGLRALQTSEDPFGARPEPATNQNAVTTVQARFSPSIERALSPETRFRLRSDNTWTRDSGEAAATTLSSAEGYFGRHSALIEHDPRPLGWRVEAERSRTRYRDDVQEPLTLDLARLSVDYALGPELTAGVRMGRERTSLLPDDDQERNIVGVQTRWQPSPRTTLSAFREKRFFGTSWRLGFDHRRPRFAWNLVLSRSLDTAPQALFELPPSDNVGALLDAMFTTRFPDPMERAAVVRDFIARQGLPTQTLRPTAIHAQRLSLVTLRSATLALIGVRQTVSLTGFQSRTEDAAQASAVATGGALTNNTQYGAAAALTHRLSPTMAMTLSTDWSRIRALDAADRTIQRSARVRLNVQATPKTTAFGGARYRDLDSNVATEGREGAVFVGLDHSF